MAILFHYLRQSNWFPRWPASKRIKKGREVPDLASSVKNEVVIEQGTFQRSLLYVNYARAKYNG
jgi:hypothetical protein